MKKPPEGAAFLGFKLCRYLGSVLAGDMRYNAVVRRIRFSLRTLLAVTALVAVLLFWIEWNRRIVRGRQSLLGLGWNRVAYWYLAEPSSSHDYRDHTKGVVRAARRSGNISASAEAFPATEVCSVSWLRRRLGDRPYFMIETSDPQLVPRIRKWFPEAVCMLDEKP